MINCKASEGFSSSETAAHAHASIKMKPLIIILFTCALVAAIDQKFKDDILNNTNLDKRVLQRIKSLLDADIALDQRDLVLLNRTATTLGVNKETVDKLSSLVNKTEKIRLGPDDIERERSYNAYEDGEGAKMDPKIKLVEESPDYASSVVLASDLLSLTSAVATVRETACREQGYKFLDGLLLNKRWALKSK